MDVIVMAMFDRQGIPERIVYDGQSRLQFEDAVAPLMSFSLIRLQSRGQPEQQTGEGLFEMHGLVQLATRKWLEVQGQASRWQTTSLRIMGAAFPSGQHETWTSCWALLPHSQKVLCYPREGRAAALDGAKIAGNTGWYLLHMGEYAAAAEFLHGAVMARDRSLGAEHPDTLTSVSKLGTVLESQGKYEEAEAMHRRALGGYEKVLGAEHPDMLTSMANLASLFWSQSLWEEAEELEMRVLETSKKVLGEKHPDTLTAMHNLAFTLKSEGRGKEADSLMNRCHELRKSVLGRHHSDT